MKFPNLLFGDTPLIEKTMVTSAEVLDPVVVSDICPDQGMVFMDKLYDRQDVDKVLKEKGCHAVTIQKDNNKRKNKDLDKWVSRRRMPFEGTFSKLRRRTKFRGLEKVNMQNTMESICHNLKKAVTLLPIQNAP